MQPFVSVLIPVRNEERYIERCLYSLAAQDYPRERFEVLVIDGRSTDHTREIVARFAAESTLDLRLIDNPRRKTAAGLNAGLAQARGDVIVRVDGHASVASDYLRRGVFALFDSGADCVGGVIESEGDTYAGRAIALAMSSRFGVGGVGFRVGGEGPVETVAFGAYRRDVFDRIGTFTEDIDKGEDDEFNYRLRDAGGLILLVPEMHARYTVRGDLRGAMATVLRIRTREAAGAGAASVAGAAAAVRAGGAGDGARRIRADGAGWENCRAQGARGGVYWRRHHRIPRFGPEARLAISPTAANRLRVSAPLVRIGVRRRSGGARRTDSLP